MSDPATEEPIDTEPFTPKRGRPTAAQAEAIRRTILDAAAELFMATSYEATTMEAVAKSAGVPKSTLYKRYPDKIHLIRAVLKYKLANWSEITKQQTASLPLELRPRLIQRAKDFFNWSVSTEVRLLIRLVSGMQLNVANEVGELLYDIGYLNLVSIIKKDLLELSDVPVKSAEDTATAFLAMLSGWILSKPSNKPIDITQAHAFAEQAVTILFDGKNAW